MSGAKANAVGNSRGAFYRLARELHGYLSALAFLALLFFSATGILLNHPEWMPAREAARQTQSFTLDAATLARVRAQSGDAQIVILAAAVARRGVLGSFSTGEAIDTEMLLRFEGPRGNTTATVDLRTGGVELEVERANMFSMLNDLHRGKNAGAAWRWMIDIVGVTTLLLSLIGFVIFFSLRFRLGTSLALVAAGAAAMAAVYLFAVT